MRWRWMPGMICLCMSFFLWGCGYSREEKDRMEAIETLGRANAENYIKDKYGWEPDIDRVRVCMEREDGAPAPWANGYVLADMSHEGRAFQVHISGEVPKASGRDDYQHGQILEEAAEYFEALLGYELYDVYLEYREAPVPDTPLPRCHDKNLIEEFYEEGSFEEFLRRHPSSIRIDDCVHQDLRDLWKVNPGAAVFFQEYADCWQTKAVLISYRSREDYLKGYNHTYGEGGSLTFDICKDGLYIGSYAAFEKDRMRAEAFELQERYGMSFSCSDRIEGGDLTVLKGEREWMDLGETDRKPKSQVYSIQREHSGEITVYIPVRQSGKKKRIFIQHQEDGRWWQYEADCKTTEDNQYIFFVFHGVHEGSFDFIVD